MPLSRRHVLLGSACLCAGTAYAGWQWTLTPPDLPAGATQFTVTQAHRAAAAGDVVLIDIRRPDEWQRTGIGQGALPLDMRRDDFVQALDQITGGDRTRPVALICARGVRSAYLTQVLTDAGYSRLIDVPEGMLGSRAGPGWLRSGLPVVAAQ